MPRASPHRSSRLALAEDIALEHLCWATTRGGFNYADICTALGIGRLGAVATERALALAWLRLDAWLTVKHSPQFTEAAE